MLPIPIAARQDAAVTLLRRSVPRMRCNSVKLPTATGSSATNSWSSIATLVTANSSSKLLAAVILWRAGHQILYKSYASAEHI